MSRDFYIRQLWDGKGSALVELMAAEGDDALRAALWPRPSRGRTRAPGDAIAISSYLGSRDAFDRAMSAFAEAYADQNERDYASLREAAASGRVAAETGL